MNTVISLIHEATSKLKVINTNISKYKYFDVCVYDTLFKNWQCTCDKDKFYKTYESAETVANEIIEEKYYKGLQIIASVNGKSWDLIATWGRQKFRNK